MHHHKTYMCINFQQNRVETQVVTVLKIKSNINLAFKNSEKHRHTITLIVFIDKDGIDHTLS